MIDPVDDFLEGLKKTVGPNPLEVFVKLAQVLTAHQDIQHRLARTYLRTLIDGAVESLAPYKVADIEETLKLFHTLRGKPDLQQVVRTEIVNNPTLGPVAKTITYLFYTAALPTFTTNGPMPRGWPVKMSAKETYPEALIWSALSIEPQGLAGAYYGYWAYPPPASIEDPDSKAPEPK